MGRFKTCAVKIPQNKKDGSSKKRKQEGGSSQQKPTKMVKPSTGSSKTIDPLPLDFFWDEQLRSRYLAEENRSIAIGQSLGNLFLRSHGFETLYQALLYQNWQDFLTIFCNYEPALIRQCFVNLRLSKNHSGYYETIIYGKRTSICAPALFRFLYPDMEYHFNTGVIITSNNFESIYPGYNHDTALRSLQDPACTNFKSTSVADLSLDNRLLHHIVTRTVCPRSGTFSTVTPLDVGIMFLIRNHVKISIPHLIIHHISKVAASNHPSLPYGMLLTKFFKEFQKIPQILASTISPEVKTATYCKHTLSLLFRLDVASGSWVRKFPLSSSPSSSNAPPSSSSRDQDDFSNEDLHNFIRDCFSSLEARIDASSASLNSRIANLELMVKELQSNQSSRGRPSFDDVF